MDEPGGRGASAPEGPAPTRGPKRTPAAPATRSSWRSAGELAAVFVLALAARWIYLAELRSSPAFEVPIVDSLTYDQQAIQIASGRPPAPLPFWQPPLYPLFLAGLYTLFGHSVGLARFAQAVLGALNCVFIVLLGRRLFGRREAVVAGLGACLYGPLLFFDGEILAPVLVLALDLAALIFLARALDGGLVRDWAVAGLALGLSAITWPNILLFVPAAVLLPWLVARRGEASGKRARESRWDPKRGRARGSSPGPRPGTEPDRATRADDSRGNSAGPEGAGRGFARTFARPALLLTTLIVPILPVTLRNLRVSGEFVPISTNGGINFYIGNNPRSDETQAIRPGYFWGRLTAMPRDRAGITSESAASAWFFEQSLAWARTAPVEFARLQVRKLREYWVSWEKKRNQDLYDNTLHSRLLGVLVFRVGGWGFPFGIVGAIGLAGVWLLRAERRAWLPILFVATQVVAVVIFFASDRYRLPIVPVLLLFGSAWIVRLAGAIRERRGRDAARMLATAAVLGLLIALAGRAPSGASEAETLLFVGSAKREIGDLAGAESDLRRSIALDPSDAEPFYALGNLLLARRLPAEAEEVFRRGLSVLPAHTGCRVGLGRALLLQKRPREAIAELERVTREDPGEETAWFHLGLARAADGDASGAMTAFSRAIEIEPRFPDPYYSLAQLVATRDHDTARAVDLLRTAIRLDPNHPKAADAGRMLELLTGR